VGAAGFGRLHAQSFQHADPMVAPIVDHQLNPARNLVVNLGWNSTTAINISSTRRCATCFGSCRNRTV
jgi:hypothetical protein